MFTPGAGAACLGPAAGASALAGLDIDLSALEEILNPGDGNTTYEQLEAIGYDPREDSMVGVIRVRKPAGYSGGTCSNGSIEHVTFWADIDGNGSFETCLGTASVRVYDLGRHFPRAGLEFAVHLPVNLARYRRPCNKGARIIPIRAILSWATPIPCPDPNKRPVWGNRLETLIHVAPGNVVGNTLSPELAHVGAIQIDHIQPNGLTSNSFAIGTGLHVNNSPFDGRIDLAGKILNGNAGTRYRFMIREAGVGSFLPLSFEPAGITVQVVTPGPIFTDVTMHADAEGYYLYQDVSANHYVTNQILAKWQAAGAEQGKTFELRLDVKDPGNPAVDIEGAVVAVRINHIGPDLDLGFTALPGDCAHFDEGAVFHGVFTVTAEYFGGFTFRILPDGPANGVLPDPAAGSSVHLGGLISDPGVVNEPFELDTSGTPPAGSPPDAMSPCGYALFLQASDRTNVNSGGSYHNNDDSIGFCLGSPPHADS
jgi:hypothetical protein